MSLCKAEFSGITLWSIKKHMWNVRVFETKKGWFLGLNMESTGDGKDTN